MVRDIEEVLDDVVANMNRYNVCEVVVDFGHNVRYGEILVGYLKLISCSRAGLWGISTAKGRQPVTILNSGSDRLRLTVWAESRIKEHGPDDIIVHVNKERHLRQQIARYGALLEASEVPHETYIFRLRKWIEASTELATINDARDLEG